jgi:DNA-binding transcriptional regulator GbsR (MarR family)
MVRDERALQEFAERAAGLLAGAGFPRMPARVLMTLMVAEGDGMTAAELADRLDVSAAAISGAVQYLRSVAMVHRVAQPGSRRALYQLPQDSWYTASMHNNPVYDAMIALSRSALDAAGDPGNPTALRIAEWVDFMGFLKRRLPGVLAEWKESRAGAG